MSEPMTPEEREARKRELAKRFGEVLDEVDRLAGTKSDEPSLRQAVAENAREELRKLRAHPEVREVQP